MKNQWVSCPEPICQTGGCPYFWVPNTVFFVDDPFSFSLPTMNKNDKTSSLAWNYFLPVMHYFLIFFVASLAKYQWDTQVVGEHGEKTRKKCPIYIYPPKKIEKRNILKSDGWFFYGFLGLLRVAIHLLPRFWGSSEAAPKTDTQTLLWVLGDGPSGPSTRRRVGNHQADWHWKLIEYFLNINSKHIYIYIYIYVCTVFCYWHFWDFRCGQCRICTESLIIMIIIIIIIIMIIIIVIIIIIYIYTRVCACMDSMCDIIKYACICMYIRMYDLFLNAYDNTWNNWAEFFCSC